MCCFDYACMTIMDFIYLFYLVECLGYMITLSNPFCNCEFSQALDHVHFYQQTFRVSVSVNAL